VIVLNRAATDAFDDLPELLVTRSPGMERGHHSLVDTFQNILKARLARNAISWKDYGEQTNFLDSREHRIGSAAGP
jgi:hypothetical protein